jgi:capsule polysaccharide export protein KpsE/RkpR
MLDNDFAAKRLSSALQALDQANTEVRRRRVYVELISAPSLPDSPFEPRRLRNITATFILSLLTWGVLSMFVLGVKEHYD